MSLHIPSLCTERKHGPAKARHRNEVHLIATPPQAPQLPDGPAAAHEPLGRLATAAVPLCLRPVWQPSWGRPESRDCRRHAADGLCLTSRGRSFSCPTSQLRR